MSSRHKVQDATGVVVSVPGVGIMHIILATAPTDTDPGYGPGCIWQNTAGSAGTLLYTNIGTAASANWLNIA